MATGDILSGTIDATGHWLDIVVAGLSTGGTYLFGMGTNNDPATGTPKISIDVLTLGYTNGSVVTKHRTIYATHAVRLPYNAGYTPPYPNNEVASGGNVTVRVALSQRIYQKENTGGGNSGTAPMCTILAGFYTQAATPNNAASSFALTNNSTAAYPIPKGRWDRYAGQVTADRVTGNFPVAFAADATYGVDIVAFDAVGETSAHNATQQVVSSMTSTQRSATLLNGLAYVATIPISGMTGGELIDVRARVYPSIGDTILDTNNNTTLTNECLGYNKMIVAYNTTVNYAYVDASVGVDATGVVSTTAATAALSPFRGAGKAIQHGANVIYLKANQNHDGFHDYPASPVVNTEWYVIQPEPGHSSADVTWQPGTGNGLVPECKRVMIKGVKVQLASAAGYADGNGEDNSIRFRDCVFDSNGFNATNSVGHRMFVTYIDNCTGDLGVTKWALTQASTTRAAFCFDGCVFSAANNETQNVAWYDIIACSCTGGVGFGERSVSISPNQDNFRIDGNKWFGYNNSASSAVLIGTNNDITIGGIIRNNVWEQIVSGAPLLSIAGDTCVAIVNNVSIDNNTSTGDRWNIGYNPSGSTAYAKYDWRVSGNIVESMATKHDTFTGSGGANIARIGGWPVLYSHNWSGNVNAQIASIGASGSFAFESQGIKSYSPAVDYTSQPPGYSTTNAKTYVKFTNRTAWDGTSGTSGGDYTLTASSPAVNMATNAYVPFDIVGTARKATDAAGAFAGPVTATSNVGFWI